jgi:hypothetical protein
MRGRETMGWIDAEDEDWRFKVNQIGLELISSSMSS